MTIPGAGTSGLTRRSRGVDRGDQLDVPGLVMEQVAQRFFFKNINFNPVFCSFVQQRQLLFMFFSFFTLKRHGGLASQS